MKEHGISEVFSLPSIKFKVIPALSVLDPCMGCVAENFSLLCAQLGPCAVSTRTDKENVIFILDDGEDL